MYEKYDAELEQGLPESLRKPMEKLKEALAILDAGGDDSSWEGWWYDVCNSTTVCELSHEITAEQARYIRETYLRLVLEDV